MYYFSKASLKTANKQYTTVQNDYEMTFNPDTIIEPCDDDSSLPTMNFNFVKINELSNNTPNSLIGVLSFEYLVFSILRHFYMLVIDGCSTSVCQHLTGSDINSKCKARIMA